MLLANIFSFSAGCLFVLSLVSFPVQEYLRVFNWVPFVFSFSFFFFLLVSVRKSQKILLWFTCLPMFSSRNFMVSGHTLRSLIHFEFIFLSGVTECSNFILFSVSVQSSQHCLLKRLYFPSIYSCLFCWFIVSTWVTFWNLSCSIGLCVLFWPVLCVSISCIVPSEVRKSDTSILKVVLAIHVLLYFHTDLRIICSSQWKLPLIFHRDCIEFQVTWVVSNHHLNNND